MTTAKLLTAAAVVAKRGRRAGPRPRHRRPTSCAKPAGKLSVDGMYIHLGKLQEIADANKRTHNVHILGTILGADVGVCRVAQRHPLGSGGQGCRLCSLV